MTLEQFWNEAIKSYFVNDNEDVFVSFSKEIIDDIINSFLKTLPNRLYAEQLRESLISLNGGNEKSYYKAIKKAIVFSKFKEYPFLKFSFFPFVAFQLHSRAGYWDKLTEVDNRYIGSGLNRNAWIGVLNGSMRILQLRCHEEGKNFLHINIFGKDSNLINVGRIYTHAVLQISHLEEIKRAICSLHYTNIPIEDLDEEAISNILVEADLVRAYALFNDCPELIVESVKTLLKEWKPTQEEVIKLSTSSKSDRIATGVPLKRIWQLEYNPNGTSYFYIRLGFAWKAHLGIEGKIFLNEEKNIYIDLDYSPPKPESWNKYIYLLNHASIEREEVLENRKWDLKFKTQQSYLFHKLPIALKSISGGYFFEISECKVLFSSEKVVHVSKQPITGYNELLTPLENLLVNNYSEPLYFYLVIGEGEVEGITYIKVNHEIDLKIIGVGDGISGLCSFLSRFPIQLLNYSPAYGELQVVDSGNNIILSIDANTNVLKEYSFTIDIPGDYKVKILDKESRYLKFKDGNDYKQFRIVERGTFDKRIESLQLHNEQLTLERRYRAFSWTDIEENWKILFKNDWEFKYLPHFLFDFVFNKEVNFISLDKNKFFIIAVPEAPLKLQHVHTYKGESHTKQYNFTSTSNQDYKFTAKAVFNAEISIPINNEWYNYDLIRQSNVSLEVFKFEMVDTSNSLKDKYPDLHPSILLITNCRSTNNPELLMEMYCQESFPFKPKVRKDEAV